MRLKPLLQHNYFTFKKSVYLFLFFYIIGSLAGGILSTLSTGTVFGVSGDVNGSLESFSIAIFSFGIFIGVCSLVFSQKETCFLITRSVSRKEIFSAYGLFMLPFGVGLSVIQMALIYLDALVRMLLGAKWRGLELDAQCMMAPNMKNPAVFFLVTCGILLSLSFCGYLLGSLISRWKVWTIGGLILFGILFITSLSIPAIQPKVFHAFRYLFSDSSNGLWIAGKHLGIAAAAYVLAFPVVRKIKAA